MAGFITNCIACGPLKDQVFPTRALAYAAAVAHIGKLHVEFLHEAKPTRGKRYQEKWTKGLPGRQAGFQDTTRFPAGTYVCFCGFKTTDRTEARAHHPQRLIAEEKATT